MHGAPFGEIARQSAPGAASALQIENGTKDIVRSNDVHVEQREEVRQKPTIIRKEDVTELQKNLEKLQDQRSDIADQISSIQHLKDRDSMQMLHHLNLEQSSIQNNILSIKTQMTEMVQA